MLVRFQRVKMEKVKKIKLDNFQLDKQLGEILDWVQSQIEKNDIPRFSDVILYAHQVMGYTQLSRKKITEAVRLLPNYVMNSTQARQKFRSDRNRPMIVNQLGRLHSDICFYSVNANYAMPLMYRSGFIVAKDTLSRFIFVSILKHNRKAKSMVTGFTEIFEKFKQQYPEQPVISIAFDKERSVMGHTVQNFLKENNILFYAFENTSSKSKMAENSIRLIRTTISRMKGTPADKKWWLMLEPAVASLNSKPIRINGKFLKMKEGGYYAPKDVTTENVEHYKRQLQKANSSYYLSQFDVDPELVTFKYDVNAYVRPKLIVISSEVLGTKRSEVTLSDEIFIIKKQIAYVSRRNSIENAYICQSLTSKKIETFSEDEIALTPSPYF